MGLLAQLFRHKNAPRDEGTVPAQVGGAEIREIGAIAAAVGLRHEPGMPGDFQISLGDLLQRIPPQFVCPGKHDTDLVLRIPAAEVSPGLARGRAEISLARLVAMAPDIFRWERSESEEPKVRLPLQKLLLQISSIPPLPATVPEQSAGSAPMAWAGAAAVASQLAAGTEVATAELPSVGWEQPVVAANAEPPVSAPQAGSASREEASIPVAKLPEQAAAATHLTLHVAPADPVPRTVELRPSRDVSISSTLRAVVLGGVASGSSLDVPSLGGHILAPRPPASPPVATASPGAAPSILPASESAGPAADFAGLQSLFMTSVPIELADVAALTAALPGVHACLIRGVAGSAEAGEMPPGLNVEEVRAASEEFARKIGGVESTTIHRGELAIAIFTRGGICLSAVTDAAGFVPGVRERLLKVTELLAGGDSAHQ
jgi:hypothetical protein